MRPGTRHAVRLSSVPAGAPGEGHAVVIGAGMAGLLAAHELAAHYRTVTLVDRDRMTQTPGFRPGVPQSRHTHLLLGRGLETLELLLPGLVPELIAEGGVPIDWPGDALWLTPAGWSDRFRPGMSIVSASRDLIEWLVRRRVLAHPRISLLEATRVTALAADDSGGRVAGVVVAEGGGKGPRTLAADLVLDASGRSSAAPQWLADLGFPVPEELTAPSDVGYASRFYEQPACDGDWRLLLLQTRPPRHTRSGMLLPVDGGRWMVSLVGVNGDHPPTDEKGFLEFARTLRSPVLYDAIRTARPLTPIHGFRVPDSRRRRFDRMRARPEGFAVVGDALCSLNPMYAQGMSVAAMTALALREELADGPAHRRLGSRLQNRAARAGSDAWLIASGEDLRYLPPEVRGRRLPQDRLMTAYFDRVLRTATTDRTVSAALLRVLNLQSGPYSLVRPGIVLRALGRKERPPTTTVPAPAVPHAETGSTS
ncbi:FAD-dependent oxidoreductase [Streptomyces sp.]|uniref:FAD-dependent oxidoreductase n=1 Tax=Streptomyces sp. TaxID=1931 RepID=UPI002F415A05